MALTDQQRRKLPASDFALPKERKYPIQNINQARIAIAYAAKADRKTKAKVYRAVWRRYPSARKWPSIVRWKQAKPNPRNPHKARPNQTGPQWVEIGRRVDLVIIKDGQRRTVELTDEWRVATEPSMKTIFFVKVKRPSRVRANSAAADAWNQWTWGGEVDQIDKAARPNDGPWRSIGRIQEIYYDGRLAEAVEGPARRVHKFKGTRPMLQTGPDGPRVNRAGSKYRVTSRGIIG